MNATTIRDPLIRRTQGKCPDCLRTVPAEVRETNGRIWLTKQCPRDGASKVLLSEHPDYYRDLHNYYFGVMRRQYPQRDYILRLTERCNLECPICLAGANQEVLEDYTLEEVQRLVRGMRGRKIDLMGCEPTVMHDLPAIIRAIKASGNIAALHSNGVALADYDYVKQLKDAGMDEVHLQFDGFSDDAYTAIRGKHLLANKLKAMENLARLGVSVDLVMTILAGVNEDQILPVLEFGVQHPNVKEIFFLGCRMLGRATGKFESSQLLPDQVIDILARVTNDTIGRDKVRRFQKLYFALLSAFGVRKCLYIQHYLLIRNDQGGFATLDDIIDMPRLERVLEKFRERRERGSRLAVPLLLLAAAPRFINLKALALVRDFLALSLLMAFGFNLRKVRKRAIMLGYITACDPLIFDATIAENCGKGEISKDLGTQESGATANVLREHRWRQ